MTSTSIAMWPWRNCRHWGWRVWRRMAAHWRDAYEIGAANRWLPLEALYVPVVESNVEIIEGDSPEEKATALAQKLRAAKLV